MEIENRSLDEFYEEVARKLGKETHQIMPPLIQKEIGHFNVFDIADTLKQVKATRTMPYNRRTYYKISLIRGRNRAEYADKVIQVERNALLFGTPRVPYHWIPQDEYQSGLFCVFTEDFLQNHQRENQINQLPIFQSSGYPVFELTDQQADSLSKIFIKMKDELSSDYAFKYDLIRHYLMELIHIGQKMQPAAIDRTNHQGAARIISLFIELLERQFPIDSPMQRLALTTAREYADRLSVHVNHLNKVLKENTGKTTTEIIRQRVLKESKILLRQTTWSISEIAFSLGFEEVAHFSNFFKKHTNQRPMQFRSL